jgi:hypothetical protein
LPVPVARETSYINFLNPGRQICRQAAWLGLELDAAGNERHGPCISTPASKVTAWVLPTNETLMIARHTLEQVMRSAAWQEGYRRPNLCIANNLIEERTFHRVTNLDVLKGMTNFLKFSCLTLNLCSHIRRS